jgi:hypothetical protein
MILQCRECGSPISVSTTGSGDDNVTARFVEKAFGVQYATKWRTCRLCGAPYCEGCARMRGSVLRRPRCACGGVLSEKYNAKPP